ncbi:TPA: MFS transporter, partial [Bacillus anthracis]|nr:MFS transporter [Bacillus anthracis]
SMMYEGTAFLFIIGLLFILPIYNLKPTIVIESEISGKGSAIQNES